MKSIKETLRGRQAELRAYAEGKKAYIEGHGTARYKEQYANRLPEWEAFCMGWNVAHFWLGKGDKSILKGDGEHEPFN